MSRFPWRDTSEDIAGQSNSQWETPAGAQAKADKALQEAKQYTDEKNQDFTDHINNKTIHVTQADKDNWNSKAPGNHTHPNATQTQAGFESPEDKRKLDGIAAGAEVNQNAFSKVNDVEAQSKTDTVTLKGGTGITVSTNKATKEVTITATGEAIPGPHGSSHDHDGADPIPELVEIRERLEYTESKELTLQPGVQLVTAKRDARFKLGSMQGKTEINGQGRIGIIGVENPYVTRISGNLLPPFDTWSQSQRLILITPYKASLSSTSENIVGQVWSGFEQACMPGKTYTFSSNHNGLVQLAFYDQNMQKLSGAYITDTVITAQAPANAVVVGAYVGNKAGTGTFTFENPMLSIGSDSKPFVPREDVMLAFQTELHANPTDGSEPDELFERDGQYFKLAKWRKLTIDASLNYTLRGGFSGFKTFSFPLTGVKSGQESGFLIKFNGTKLINPGNDTLTQGDMWSNRTWESTVILSIANSDSGWGDNYYEPTPDEIKAYFNGFIMGDISSGTFKIPYNRTDGLHKAWRYAINDNSNGTTYWPSVQAFIDSNTYSPGWNPYNLLYRAC